MAVHMCVKLSQILAAQTKAILLYSCTVSMTNTVFLKSSLIYCLNRIQIHNCQSDLDTQSWVLKMF